MLLIGSKKFKVNFAKISQSSGSPKFKILKKKIGLRQNKVLAWAYSFSTFAKFSEKLLFLPPDTHMTFSYQGQKCYFLKNFLQTY